MKSIAHCRAAQCDVEILGTAKGLFLCPGNANRALEISISFFGIDRDSRTLNIRDSLADEGRKNSARHDSRDQIDEVHRPVEQSQRRLDEPRLVALLHGLHNLSDLRQAASSAQVEVREKMLEVGYKRNNVAQADANFMKELQRLQVQQQLGQFEELSKLAAECQLARDGLGPLENESAQIFGNWEGKMWVLGQEEDALYNEFAYEFAPQLSSVGTDMVSSEGSSTSANSEILDDHCLHDNAGLIPVRPGSSVVSFSSIPVPTTIYIPPQKNTVRPNQSQNSMLLGLISMEQSNSEEHEDDMMSDLDSGIANLDRDSETGIVARQSSGPESFPKLLTDFSTRRDRVRKWLLQTTLVSKSEANLVGWQLMSQSPDKPSNWSQLVVALLELDEAVSKWQFGSRNRSPEEEEENMNLDLSHGGLHQPSNRLNQNTTLNEYKILGVTDTPPKSLLDDDLGEAQEA
ncbi:hypothetical protein ACMFMG_011180 [Clarireedia jacksonii]